MFGYIKDIIRKIRIIVLHIVYGCLSADLRKEDLQNVVLIAPHPDDEVLGCSGLISYLKAQGIQLNIIFLTKGEASHRGCCDTLLEDIKQKRVLLAKTVAERMGLLERNLHFLDYADGAVANGGVETEKLNKIIKDIKPKEIFVPCEYEGWPDHISVKKIIMDINDVDIKLYSYCIWYWYYNVWHLRVKCSKTLSLNDEERSIKNLNITDYTSAVAKCGKPWVGELPKLLVDAAKWDKELYFRDL